MYQAVRCFPMAAFSGPSATLVAQRSVRSLWTTWRPAVPSFRQHSRTSPSSALPSSGSAAAVAAYIGCRRKGSGRESFRSFRIWSGHVARDAQTGTSPMSVEAMVELAQQGAFDGEAVRNLRALSSEAREELLKELWEPAMSLGGGGGAWAVHAAFLASDHRRLAQLATSGSQAVGVRALTALLKTDPARLISLLGLPQGGKSEGSPLSAARRRVALRALGRLSHNALQGLVNEELLSELVLTDRPSAARLLKGASPELIERWWPRLTVPSNTAAAIAARLPKLTLSLIANSRQKQWREHELREVVGVCAASTPAALEFLELLAKQPAACTEVAKEQPNLFLWLLQGLCKKEPKAGLEALAKIPSLGRADRKQWGTVLRRCACLRPEDPAGDLWRPALEVAIKLIEEDHAHSYVRRPGFMKRYSSVDLAPLFRALKPARCLSQEQLGALFARLGLLSLLDSRSCLSVLRPWNQDSDVEAALSALVASTPQTQLPASLAADITGLAHWTPQARLLLAQKLTQEKPPEVPGGAVNSTYLEALSWQPYADVEAEIKRRCSSSSPEAREAGLRELMKCASRDRDAPVAVRDALSFFEVRLRNEQDSVRAAVLEQMAKAPVLLWQDMHVKSLRQLLTSSMQAKGSSSESLEVWRQLVQVFVANGAALRTEFGLGPCGAFGMEVRAQMTAADLWDKDDADFGTGVLSQVARLEPQQAFVAFPWLVDFLRPSIRALLDSGKVDKACALLARWEGTRLELLQRMPDIPDACAAFDVLLRETFATAIQESRSFNPSVAKAAQEALRALLLPSSYAPRLLPSSYTQLSNSKGLTWAQEKAVRRLCQLSSSWWQSLLGRINSELPWHATLALEFLGSAEPRHLLRQPALFDELVQALCTNWDMLAEWQRAQFAAEVVQRLDSACRSMEMCLRLAPLLQRLCDWPFSLALGEPGTEKFSKSVGEVGYNIRLRCQAEEMLARHKPLKASFLEGWRRQDASLKAERLCTSAVLLRAVQQKPEAIQLLVGLESSKLQQLRLLQASGAQPLHFFGQEWTSNRGPRPFFSWPAALQRSFADAWLALEPLGLQDFMAGSEGGSQVREKCRLRLALPALRCEGELGRVVEACVEVLKSEAAEDSTALAVARGRAGQLLDRLIPLLARADRAKELAPLLSAQLGQGNSKQVARSFQVLLRRLGSRDASATLEAAFRSPLKVAERVALLRDSSEHGLFNRPDPDFVALMESLYESHRDVGGAVLVALCRMGQTSLLTRVSQEESSLYQLQILLRQLSSPASDLWRDEVAGILATLCQRPDVGDQCLRCLSDWALSEGAHDASTVAAVASAACEALTSKTESFLVIFGSHFTFLWALKPNKEYVNVHSFILFQPMN
ncbi:unnamed protein product [Symbiodinium sp. CCMP2592]|nr:unnamed protein product [Symbiodinium sp. CCMP2592]